MERALAAAQASFRTGAFDAALALLAVAQAEPLDGFQSAQTDLLRGQVAFASGRVSDAAPLLLKAAKRLEPFDPQRARETYLTAWGRQASPLSPSPSTRSPMLSRPSPGREAGVLSTCCSTGSPC